MIDHESKQKLLQELEKTGIVFSACLKSGIDKSTYYRWLEKDKGFSKQAKRAVRLGRTNIIDIAEHALLLNVKDKKMDAIKYVLSHNSPRYRQKTDSKVTIQHFSKKEGVEKRYTFTDLMRDLDNIEKGQTDDVHPELLKQHERDKKVSGLNSDPPVSSDYDSYNY